MPTPPPALTVDGFDDATPALPAVVDFPRAARRIRMAALVLGSVAVIAWLVVGLASDSLRGSALAGWFGAALGGMFLVEVVVVGGSALRGMIRAGDQGHRLAQGDVGLIPPQLMRRGRR